MTLDDKLSLPDVANAVVALAALGFAVFSWRHQRPRLKLVAVIDNWLSERTAEGLYIYPDRRVDGMVILVATNVGSVPYGLMSAHLYRNLTWWHRALLRLNWLWLIRLSARFGLRAPESVGMFERGAIDDRKYLAGVVKPGHTELLWFDLDFDPHTRSSEKHTGLHVAVGHYGRIRFVRVRFAGDAICPKDPKHVESTQQNAGT